MVPPRPPPSPQRTSRTETNHGAPAPSFYHHSYTEFPIPDIWNPSGCRWSACILISTTSRATSSAWRGSSRPPAGSAPTSYASRRRRSPGTPRTPRGSPRCPRRGRWRPRYWTSARNPAWTYASVTSAGAPALSSRWHRAGGSPGRTGRPTWAGGRRRCTPPGASSPSSTWATRSSGSSCAGSPTSPASPRSTPARGRTSS